MDAEAGKGQSRSVRARGWDPARIIATARPDSVRQVCARSCETSRPLRFGATARTRSFSEGIGADEEGDASLQPVRPTQQMIVRSTGAGKPATRGGRTVAGRKRNEVQQPNHRASMVPQWSLLCAEARCRLLGEATERSRPQARRRPSRMRESTSRRVIGPSGWAFEGEEDVRTSCRLGPTGVIPGAKQRERTGMTTTTRDQREMVSAKTAAPRGKKLTRSRGLARGHSDGGDTGCT